MCLKGKKWILSVVRNITLLHPDRKYGHQKLKYCIITKKKCKIRTFSRSFFCSFCDSTVMQNHLKILTFFYWFSIVISICVTLRLWENVHGSICTKFGPHKFMQIYSILKFITREVVFMVTPMLQGWWLYGP